MMAYTHVTFGVLTTVAAGAAVGAPLHRDLPALAAAALASLLPDVDHPRSVMGRLCPAWAACLERTVGHRTLTHSLAATGGLALLTAPILAVWPTAYAALLLGFLSHLAIDCGTMSGVPLLYPNRRTWVFPRSPAMRFETGSRAETVLALGLVVATVASVAVSQRGGFYRSMRYLLATPSAAYHAYQEAATQTVLVFEGRWHHTRQPVTGRAMLLEATDDAFVVYWHGEVLRCAEQGDLVADRVWVETTDRPLQTRRLSVHDESWAALLAALPSAALASGQLTAAGPLAACAPAATAAVAGEPRQYPTVTLDDSVLTLNYASRAKLQAMGLGRRVTAARAAQQRQAFEAASRRATLMHLRRSPPAYWAEIVAAEEERDGARARCLALADTLIRVTGNLELRWLEEEP